MSDKTTFTSAFASGANPTTGQVVLNFILFMGLIIVTVGVAGGLLYLVNNPVSSENATSTAPQSGATEAGGETDGPVTESGGTGEGDEVEGTEENASETGEEEEESGATDESGSIETCSASYEKKFKDDCVTAHNEYRKKHGVPNVKHVEKLNEYAKEWAENLIKTGEMKHRKDSKYGENLYGRTVESCKETCDKAVKMWYDEIKDFGNSYGKESPPSGTGHFTQVVWKASVEIGCGSAYGEVDGSNWVYVVCNYSPAGNMMGEYKKNVLKLKRRM